MMNQQNPPGNVERFNFLRRWWPLMMGVGVAGLFGFEWFGAGQGQDALVRSEGAAVEFAEPPAGPRIDLVLCLGDSVQLFAGPGESYSWSPATNLSCTTCRNPIAFPTVTTQYVVEIVQADGSVQVDSIQVLVSPPPHIVEVVSEDPGACQAADGSLLIEAEGGTGSLEFSIDGGQTWQSDNFFPGLGAASYPVAVRNDDGSCLRFGPVVVLTSDSVCTDTVQLTIPFETATQVCLDPSVFQIQGLITSASLCAVGNPATVFATQVEGECINLDPGDGFSGLSPDLICVVHCFDFNIALCDTTIVEVVVEPPPCPEVFGVDSLVVPFEGDPTEVCVPLPLAQAIFQQLQLDGQAVPFPIMGCMDTLVGYSYAPLPGGGNSGPYFLNSWEVDDTLFSGLFLSVADLVDSMNLWNPAGNWVLDTAFFSIFGGAQAHSYGNMVIVHPATGSVTTLMPNTIPEGTLLSISSPGTHTLVVTNPSDGCSDTLLILTEGAPPPTTPTDTLHLTGTQGGTLDTCLGAFLDFPGNLLSGQLCGLDAAALEAQLNGACLTLSLDAGFQGVTEVCVEHCDDSSPSVCDTTLLIVTVEPSGGCPGFFSQGTLTVDTTDFPLPICLPVPFATAQQAFITVNGAPYGGDGFPCDFGSQPDAGTLLEFPAAGTYEVVLSDSSGACRDTLLLTLNDTANPSPPQTDTLHLTTLENAPTELQCPSAAELPGNPDALLVCGAPANGTLQLDSLCFQYTPAPGFTGLDTLCVLLCDDSSPAVCDSTVYLIEVQPAPPDTVVLLTEENQPSDTLCLEASGLPAAFDTLLVCTAPLHGELQVFDSCVVYLPQPNFNGSDTACVVLCDGAAQCDTTILLIEVLPRCQPFGFLAADTVHLQSDQCFLGAELCLPLPPDSLNGFVLLDNGLPYGGGVSGCDFDTLFSYNFFLLPGMGAQGPYTLNAWTINDTLVFSGGFLDLSVLVDSLNLWDPTGGWTLHPTLPQISGGNPANLYGVMDITQDGSGQNALISPLTNFIAQGSQVRVDSGFHQLVFIELSSGCSDTLLVEVECVEPPQGCTLQPLSPLQTLLYHCDSTYTFCVDLPFSTLGNYQILDNQFPFGGSVQPCPSDPAFTALELDTGLHQLVFLDTVKFCSDTLLVEVNCLNLPPDVVLDTFVRQDDSLLLCLDDFGFELGVIDSVALGCTDQNTGNAFIEFDTASACYLLTGLFPGPDTTCLTVFIADTTASFTVHLTVLEPCPDILEPTVVGTGATVCDGGEGLLCLPITLPDFMNIAVLVDGQPYTGPIVGCDFDSVYSLNYSILPTGGLLGPYTVEAWAVNDSTFSGSFHDVAGLVDSMNLWDPLGNWTWSENAGIIFIQGGSTQNTYGPMFVTQDLTGAETILAISANFTPRGTALSLPEGTFTLVLTDTLSGCTDTVLATLACVTSEVVSDTLMVGSSDTLCLSSQELPGTFVGMSNACPGLSGASVSFEILNDSCVVYTALAPGRDSACIVLCDDLGVCDTVFFSILAVEEDKQGPIAVNDTILTGLDQPVVINVFGNDTIGFITDFGFLSEPLHGAVAFLPDGSVNYVPEPGYCDGVQPDSFQYFVCNLVGCDTATVFVFVECSELVIFEGFSPNGDGINDFFVIQGLGQYPDHKLFIFNRWGTLVFQSEDYRNDWDGKWQDKDLPDGTYFYLLDLGDGNYLSGFVQLLR